MGAKAATGAVDIELPRNSALVTSDPLIANLVIGDVAQHPAFDDAVLGETDNAILGMELGIHALNDFANQRRFIIGLERGLQNTVDDTVARECKVLQASDALAEVRVVNLVLNRAATGHMSERCQLLIADFHTKESGKRRRRGRRSLRTRCPGFG